MPKKYKLKKKKKTNKKTKQKTEYLKLCQYVFIKLELNIVEVDYL